MSAATRQRFAEVVRREPVDLGLACLLLAHEAPGALEVETGLARLDALAAQAAPWVPSTGSVAQQAEGLRVALGEHAGFAGFAEDYDDLRSSLLPDVLTRRRGLPILLSVVWLEVSRRLSVPAHGVALPGSFLVGVGAGVDRVLVDPFAGGRTISVHDAAQRVRESGQAFHRGQLKACPSDVLILRILTNVRIYGARHDDPGTQLWAVELALLLPARPVALRRERGLLLARLGDFVGAAVELDAYAEAVASAEPELAQSAHRHAVAARAQLN